MASHHQGMLTLVLTVTLAVLPSSGTILTVTPSSSNISCPTENTCLTLSEYARNHAKYFNQSNITLQFLPGNHTLDVNLTITSTQTQYLEILGSTTSLSAPSTVTCSGNAVFEFRDISEVRVSDMTFISCARGYSVSSADYQEIFQYRSVQLHYSIRFWSVQLVEVTNCVFRESFGTAVGIVNSTALVSRNNTFSSNCRKCSGGCRRNNICLGGGIYVERSNVTFHDNNVFHGNSAERGGGVYAVDSKVTFHNNNTLHGNSASRGCGVYAWHSDVTFHNNNTLHGNSAIYGGGGVYARHSDVTFHNNNTLNGNSGKDYGGGVYAYSSDLTFRNNNILHGNSAIYGGGGVYARHSDVTFHNNNTLHGNSAGYGGGVYARHSDVTFHNNNTLHGNSGKGYGGGVYAYSSDLTFRNNNILHGNSAIYGGGGVYARHSDGIHSTITTLSMGTQVKVMVVEYMHTAVI